MKAGCTLYFSGGAIPDQVVKEVLSDTQLSLKSPGAVSFTADEEYSFKIAPKIDQSSVYEHAWNLLHEEGCVGIFPEGGSHDRTELLPLKAGVSIMALGSLARFKDMKLYIVSCGLKYFKPY